jgi:hypothetical protein
MNCQNVQNSLSAHLDGILPDEERQRVLLHLARCSGCTLRSEQMVRVRRALQSLPHRASPADLGYKLRVLASRERARQAALRTPASAVAHFAEGFRMWIDNLMRPVALPFAGGLATAIILFAMLVPSFALRGTGGHTDVPTGLYTSPTVKDSLSVGVDNELILEVSVDERGRMIDYTIAQGEGNLNDTELRRRIESKLVVTEFTPATAFGMPTTGKVFVSLTRNQINITS